jgi:hypothetical protein
MAITIIKIQHVPITWAYFVIETLALFELVILVGTGKMEHHYGFKALPHPFPPSKFMLLHDNPPSF